MKGYVYILSNPSMPGIVKIGRTTRDVDARVSELYATGVPTPFEINYSVYSPNCAEMEAFAHDALKDLRVSEGREFFRVDPVTIIPMLDGFLREQLRALVDEFDESVSLVEDIYVPDEAKIHILADELGECSFDIAAAFSYVEAQELKPALDRWEAVKANRRAERAIRMNEASKVVNLNG